MFSLQMSATNAAAEDVTNASPNPKITAAQIRQIKTVKSGMEAKDTAHNIMPAVMRAFCRSCRKSFR